MTALLIHSHSWQLRQSWTVGISVTILCHSHALSKTMTQIRNLDEYNVQVISLNHMFNSISEQLPLLLQVNVQWSVYWLDNP